MLHTKNAIPGNYRLVIGNLLLICLLGLGSPPAFFPGQIEARND
jgi:hypothetical protein